jgi:hypothetical protein
MKVKYAIPVLAAIVALLAGATASQADHCGTGCAPACDDYRVHHRWCLRKVEEDRCRTCYQTVQKTVMKECKQIICEPVNKTVEKECKKIVCKPVWEEKQVKVCCGEWKTEQVYCPGAVVCRKCRQPDTCCYDPCTCKTHRVKGECVTYHEQLPGHYTCKKTWVPREEVRTVKTCKMVQEEVIEKVQVQVCETVKREVVKQVPVTVCEKVPVTYTEKRCHWRLVKEPVCKKRHHFSFKLPSFCHRDSCGHSHGCNGCSGTGTVTYSAPTGGAATGTGTLPPPKPAPK